jgi:anti-sigma factor RsiW
MEEPCKELEAYYDGELPPAETETFKAHLRVCGACEARLAELRALDLFLAPPAELTGSDISTAVLAKLSASAGHELPARALSGWWKVPALALASCAVYALCVETGLLPGNSYSLASALAVQNEAAKVTDLVFGGGRVDNEQLLAMVLEGDSK